jgi:hypothetical protein
MCGGLQAGASGRQARENQRDTQVSVARAPAHTQAGGRWPGQAEPAPAPCRPAPEHNAVVAILPTMMECACIWRRAHAQHQGLAVRLSFIGMFKSFARTGGRPPRPASLPELPPLRMFMKPVLRSASWHPAKAMDGSLQTQIVVNLECSNMTRSPIRLMTARLRDHLAEQTILLVGNQDGRPVADGPPIPSLGKARVATFFLKGRPHPPGEWFNDVVILIDEEWREHRLKIAVRGQ